MKRYTHKLLGAVVFVIGIGHDCLVFGANDDHGDFAVFWKKFSSAVIAGDKETAASLTKFPFSMPYSVKAVKSKSDFLGRYNEIFQGEANAVQCFASAKPQKNFRPAI